MKSSIIIFSLLIFSGFCAGQTTVASFKLSGGAELLFKNVKSRLTATEKEAIFKKTGFLLSKDKKQFISDSDAADYPFDAHVYPTDLNHDGREEVFIVFGNTFTSGNTGSSIIIFIKNAAGQYKSNLGFPGLLPDALAAQHLGYPDLLIGVPGMKIPIWRWNGKAYDFLKSIPDEAAGQLKSTSIESLSKAYTDKLP